MAITIQIVEKNNTIQKFLNLDNTDLDEQVITHQNDDEVVALNYATQQQPAIILLNYEIRDSETFVFINFLLEKSPDSKIIIIADSLSQKQVLDCLLAGANGFLEQKSIEKFINKAIKSVLCNEVWITRKMTAILLEHLRNF